jgi:hypothetical protein
MLSKEEELRKDVPLYVGIIVVRMFAVGILCVQLYHARFTSLPECQEDEYLYPEDYTGPGDNVPEDYECVHVDEIKEQ